MKLLSERLSWAMDQERARRGGKRVTKAELARVAGVSDTAVGFWLKDDNGMAAPVARKIGPYLGVDAEWLETGRGKAVPSAQPESTGGPVNRLRRQAALPLISWVQAGNWGCAVNEMRREDAEDWIPCPFNHGPDAFVLRVAGLSMYNPGGEKSYAPGEYIAVDPDGELLNKKMVVARIDHEERATFKQLLVDAEGTMMLQALNPEFRPRIMTLPEGSRIVGTVIGKWVPE